MSLLEALTAAAITASMMGSTVIVLRSSYASWQAHEVDLERAESAQAVLRHLVRNLRQATGVVAVTPATEDSGALSLSMPSGATSTWIHDNATGDVLFGDGAANGLLADNIETLTFSAFEADGVTAAATPADTQIVRCAVTITMPYSGATRTVTCSGWIRSW